MNIQDIGSIGEFIAAIATLGTLFYLVLHIRASNRLYRAEAWRAPNTDLNTLNAQFGTDPVFRSAIRRCYWENLGRESFEGDEMVPLDLYLISLTNICEQIFREVREGILAEEALGDFGAQNVIATRYYQVSWPVLRGNFGTSYVEYFEQNTDLVSRENENGPGGHDLWHQLKFIVRERFVIEVEKLIKRDNRMTIVELSGVPGSFGEFVSGSRQEAEWNPYRPRNC